MKRIGRSGKHQKRMVIILAALLILVSVFSAGHLLQHAHGLGHPHAHDNLHDETLSHDCLVCAAIDRLFGLISLACIVFLMFIPALKKACAGLSLVELRGLLMPTPVRLKVKLSN